jgi:hypothetical protein
MKTCNYLSESIVLITPAVGEPYKAKLVTEYGRNATGGLIVVSTRYVDAKNEVITLDVADGVDVQSTGQPMSAQSNCIAVTEQGVCAAGVPLRLVTEYGYSNTGLIVVSTRYVDAKNEVQTIAVDAEVSYGLCAEADACKGSHYQALTLVAGVAQTITHDFNLTAFTKIGYSVIGSDGTISGQWPAGVRFINHTATTVDIIADGIGGQVEVVLFNAECLEVISNGEDGELEPPIQQQIDQLSQDGFDDAITPGSGDLQEQIDVLGQDSFEGAPTPGTGDLQTQIDELSLDSFE